MDLSKAKARKMLNTIYDIACEASMTNSLVDGSEVLVANYNQIRNVAISNGWASGDWIVELKKGELLNEGDNWMDVVGAAAKLFMAHLEDEYDENGFKIKDKDEE